MCLLSARAKEMAWKERAPMTTKSLRIVVVEDQAIVREAIASLLNRRSDFEIVGTTGSVRATIPLIERLRPDLVLADLSLEDGSAVQLVRILRRSRFKVRMLIMTAFNDGVAAQEADDAGVAGVLLKEQPSEDLFAAIEMVARGERYRSPRLVTPAAVRRADGDERLMDLSHREREVLRRIALGDGSREIARRLFVSVKTVDSHRMSINRKLGVRTTAELLRFAHARGIVVAPRTRNQAARVAEVAR